MSKFAESMRAEDVNLKQIGILGKSKEDILEELETIYR